MKDKNGILIEKGATIEAPEPKANDIYLYGFVGHVDSFRNENVVVMDGDGDCFEFEPERLTVIND